MAETALTITAAPGYWSVTGAAVAIAAADNTNGNKFDAGDDLLLIAFNTGGPATITINSVALDNFTRTGDVDTQALTSLGMHVFRLTRDGWEDGNGEITISVSHSSVILGIVNLREAV